MPETILDQTHQSLKNIGFILEAAGLTMNDIVKTTIFVQDISDFNVVNEVYGTYFDTPYPSRSTIEVARLPKDAKVEIEAIAVKQ
ncbi:MAG: Rid family detoxifying hydrolase [Vagococcus sp.]